ncbi:MAG: hypothetical protein HY077_16780 [Elusimicrobia bacterium]|nr:hypothetical protein [Elusimicrobiota bacterium]
MASVPLQELEQVMGTRPPSEWVPALKRAVEDLRHGSGPAGETDALLQRVLGKAIGLAPSDSELLCLRGSLLAGQSQFEPAMKDFDRAVRLAPKSSRPYADRAYLHCRMADWDKALADLDSARRSSPDSSLLALERGLVLVSLGRAREARGEFLKARELGARDPEIPFQIGRCGIIEGSYEEALGQIREAISQSGASHRARFYAMAESLAIVLKYAQTRNKTLKTAKKKGQGVLWLFGVGIDRPYEITLDTITELKSCEVVFTQPDTREVRELLEAVYPGLRSVGDISRSSATNAERQEVVWRAVSAELGKGKKVGYVSYGHPFLFGEGHVMAGRCKAAGYEYRVFTAVSSIDGMLTMLQKDLESVEGEFHVLNAQSLLKTGRIEASAPNIVMGVNWVMGGDGFKKFCGLLESAYPKDHPVFSLKCPDGSREGARQRIEVGKLLASERELDPAASLYIPKLRSRPGGPFA